ncbi:hypothetical protein SODALDRAFT_243739, partial [Sodiomyces alkalinus F11]
METASFVVGLAGLAGLLSSCLEVKERADQYRSFTRDSAALDVLFSATKVRLEKWDRDVGFCGGELSTGHHPALDDKEFRSLVVDIFDLAKDLCDLADAHKSRSPRGAVVDKRAGSPKSLRVLGKSTRRKLVWALWGKSNRTIQVVLLKDLVDELHKLVPPDFVPDTWALRPVVDPIDTLGPGTGMKIGFADVTLIVAEQHQDLLQWMLSTTRRELHAWLRHTPDERYEDSLQRRLSGTCGWILDQPTFLEWASTEFPSCAAKVLWIHGPPGFGKTILCANIVEHITKTLPTPVAHFFFSSELDSRDDTSVVLRSWLSQVVTQHDGAFQYVLQHREADINPTATRDTIVSLFKDVVRLVASATLVVDGLDECTHLEGHNSVISFLETLTAATADTHTRILVVSRTLSIIQHALKGSDRSIFSEFRIQPDNVHSDTVAYAREIVGKKLSSSRDDVRSSLSEAMAKRCEGQFLWLELLQRKSLRTGMSKTQLREAIENTPAELDSIYDRHWKWMAQLAESDRHRAFALLRWTTFALRPLTIGEITEAVVIKDAEEIPWEDLPDDVNEAYVDGQIRYLCDPLLEIRGGSSAPMSSQQTVHLPHFTVREYLLRKLPVPDCLRPNASLAELQHTLLAKACLQYIKYSDVWQIPPHDSPARLPISFRSYAATCWHRHVNLGQRGNDEIIMLAVKFLTESSPASQAWRSFVELDDTKQHRWLAETSSTGPLHCSVKLQLMEVAMALIEGRSCDVNETNSLGRSALSLACSDGFFEIADMLLKKGANSCLADKDGLMPIHLAAQNGHVDVVRLLLRDQPRIPILTN